MTHSNKLSDDLFGEFNDMSELVDADIDRVDLVGKAANGHRFILAKSGDTNLFPSDMVRDFIEKSQEDAMSENTIEDAPAEVEVEKAETLEVEEAVEVEKADDEDLDVTEPMAEAELDVDGDEDVPGSPAWEAVDAATAAKWTGILARAKNAVDALVAREEEEIEAGAEDDKQGKNDLEDACEAIDFAISLLAPFAAREEAEARMADEIDIEKSVADVIAEFAKAELEGMTDAELARMAITGADSERKEALQELGLRSLTNPAPAAAEEVAEAPAEVEEDGESANDADSTEPAPADEVGVSADELAPEEKVATENATAEPAPVEAPAEAAAKPEEDKGVKKEKMKKAALVEERYIEVIKALEERISHLEAPAPSRVLTNGALPPAHLMRGQDAGANKFGDAQMMRKAVDEASDAVAKSEATDAMTQAALAALSDLRRNS